MTQQSGNNGREVTEMEGAEGLSAILDDLRGTTFMKELTAGVLEILLDEVKHDADKNPGIVLTEGYWKGLEEKFKIEPGRAFKWLSTPISNDPQLAALSKVPENMQSEETPSTSQEEDDQVGKNCDEVSDALQFLSLSPPDYDDLSLWAFRGKEPKYRCEKCRRPYHTKEMKDTHVTVCGQKPAPPPQIHFRDEDEEMEESGESSNEEDDEQGAGVAEQIVNDDPNRFNKPKPKDYEDLSLWEFKGQIPQHRCKICRRPFHDGLLVKYHAENCTDHRDPPKDSVVEDGDQDGKSAGVGAQTSNGGGDEGKAAVGMEEQDKKNMN